MTPVPVAFNRALASWPSPGVTVAACVTEPWQVVLMANNSRRSTSEVNLSRSVGCSPALRVAPSDSARRHRHRHRPVPAPRIVLNRVTLAAYPRENPSHVRSDSC